MKWFDELGGNNRELLTYRFEFAHPIMCATASLHASKTGQKGFRKEGDALGASRGGKSDNQRKILLTCTLLIL